MILHRIKETLESFGYEVEVNGKIKGLSGVVHDFDVLARKGETTIGVIIGNDDFHLSYVVGIVKAIDVKDTCVILLVEKKYAELDVKSSKNFHLLIYESPVDLEGKLKELIGVCENSSEKHE